MKYHEEMLAGTLWCYGTDSRDAVFGESRGCRAKQGDEIGVLHKCDFLKIASVVKGCAPPLPQYQIDNKLEEERLSDETYSNPTEATLSHRRLHVDKWTMLHVPLHEAMTCVVRVDE